VDNILGRYNLLAPAMQNQSMGDFTLFDLDFRWASSLSKTYSWTLKYLLRPDIDLSMYLDQSSTKLRTLQKIIRNRQGNK